MSQRIKDSLWRSAFFLLILLPVLTFLLRSDAMPCTHDSAFHYYRITTMKESLKQGWLFSRWVPSLALGFGYPFFNYREPLPYWAGEALLLVGFPAPLALGALYALSMFAAMWGMYVLARDLFGTKAGMVSAVVYGIAPYMLLDALRRGNMPEVWAFALIPWIFVAFRRLIMGDGFRWFIVSTALLSALFLSHNISSLMLAPFLGAYVVLLSVLYRKRRWWPWAFVAVMLTVLLTAWFWAPALLEQDYVQLHLSTSTRNNDFHYNFVSWSEIFTGLIASYYPDYLNPPMRVGLGPLFCMFAIVGAIVGIWRFKDKEQRWALGLMVLFSVLYLVFSTESTVKLWEAVDLLAFVQFPWRLVGRALLPMTLLIAAGAASTELAGHAYGRRRGRHYWVLVIAMTVIVAFPQRYPPKGMCSEEAYPDLEDVHAYEQSGWLGMDPESSYFPVWVEDHQIVTTRPELAEALQQGEEPARWDTDAMPAGAEVLNADYYSLRAELTVISPETFTARWWGLYFPGWHVKIDGVDVDVVPEEDTGLITFDVPAGEHEIRLRFGMTSLRRWATLISIIGLIGFVGCTWWLWRARQGEMSQENDGVPYAASGSSSQDASHTSGRQPQDDDVSLSRWQRILRWILPWKFEGMYDVEDDERVQVDQLSFSVFDNRWVLLGLAALSVVVQVWVLPNTTNASYGSRLNDEYLPEGIDRAVTQYDNGMRLLGYSVAERAIAGDQETEIDLMWQAVDQISGEYRTSVLLLDENGGQWSTAGTARPRGYEPAPPTTMWQSGEYAYDPHIIKAVAGTPPGDYRIVVSLFNRYTLTPATVLDANGNPLGTTLDLGAMTLLPPEQPATLAELGVADGEEPLVCDTLTLWNVTLDRDTAAPGDVFALRWVWEGYALKDTRTNVSLVGAQDKVVTTWSLRPLQAYPTSLWQTGDRWAATYVQRVPGDIDSGEYSIVVTLPDCDGAMRSGPLTINAPERSWAVPSSMESLDVRFGEDIKLVGMELGIQEPGQPLSVDLAWMAVAPLETSYKVYLHLIDPDGGIVSQNDGEPAAWTRPTTGWAAEEIVLDHRALTLPADAPVGTYTLRVGMYGDDGRLWLPDGSDGYTLVAFEVE